MLAGVRPTIRFASAPIARTTFVLASIATTDGSLMTIPRSRTWTSVLAVPRSIPMSREKRPRKRSSMCGQVLRAVGSRPVGSLRLHGAGALLDRALGSGGESPCSIPGLPGRAGRPSTRRQRAVETRICGLCMGNAPIALNPAQTHGPYPLTSRETCRGSSVSGLIPMHRPNFRHRLPLARGHAELNPRAQPARRSGRSKATPRSRNEIHAS